ncbi:MAG: hypothetical protein CMK07_15350 [Ponticaulis sp.]|nr:hypothetical protein [Ponticaulis sp.]
MLNHAWAMLVLTPFLMTACSPKSPEDAAIEIVMNTPDIPDDVREAMIFQMKRGAEAGNSGTLLPLTRRDINQVTVEDKSETRYVHSVGFGNWSVKCWYFQRPKSGQREAMCDVAPWIGPTIGEVPFPTAVGASVQLRANRDPQLTIKSPQRAANSEWSFSCGSKRWTGQSERSRDEILYGDETAAYLQVMKTRDCTVSFTAKQGGEKEVELTGHGFREAYSYAQRYVASPKVG